MTTMTTMTVAEIWESFKELSWWKKILLALPFLLSIFFAVLMYMKEEELPDEALVGHSKKKTDDIVEEFDIHIEESEKRLEEIKDNRKRIKDDIEKSNKSYNNTINRIDNTDPDKLSRIAAELRADFKRRHSSPRS